jgi:hypothetical protein
MRRILLIIVIASLPFVLRCGVVPRDQPPPPPTAASQSASVLLTPLPGGEFNQFFPESEGEFERIFDQEKEGFAQAKLVKEGYDVATLSVSDTAANPDAAQKFAQSSEEIAGYPAVAVGSKGTAILVADRFQVQIRSLDDSFTQADRAKWLAKFDLTGLAQLE